MFDFINVPANYDSMPAVVWTEAEAERIWHITDSLVPLFKQALGSQLNRNIRHEWDDGITFFDHGNCFADYGCDDCGSHSDDVWKDVETQMNPKTRLMFEALKALVPLYLDANSKMFD